MKFLRTLTFFLLSIFFFNFFCNDEEREIISERESEIKNISLKMADINKEILDYYNKLKNVVDFKIENLKSKKNELEKSFKLAVDIKEKTKIEAKLSKIEKEISILDDEKKMNDSYSLQKLEYFNDIYKIKDEFLQELKTKKEEISSLESKIDNLTEQRMCFENIKKYRENYLRLKEERDKILGKISEDLKSLSETYKMESFLDKEKAYEALKENYEKQIEFNSKSLKSLEEEASEKVSKEYDVKNLTMTWEEKERFLEIQVDNGKQVIETMVEVGSSKDEIVKIEKELDLLKTKVKEEISEIKNKIDFAKKEVLCGKELLKRVSESKQNLKELEESANKELAEKAKELDSLKMKDKRQEYFDKRIKYNALKEKYEKEIKEIDNKIKLGIEFSENQKNISERLTSLKETILTLKSNFKKIIDKNGKELDERIKKVDEKFKFTFETFKKIMNEYSKSLEYEMMYNKKKVFTTALVLSFSAYGFYKFCKSIFGYFSLNAEEEEYTV